MILLESTIKTILAQLKPTLAKETWESRRRYFSQMQRCADALGINEPCQELYDAFIADDNGSPERRSLHSRCVKLVDALAGTKAKDCRGMLFNEPPMPEEADTLAFFRGISFPIGPAIPMDALIIKAEIELRSLRHTDSTAGQYKHAWMEIRRYYHDSETTDYDENTLYRFIQETENRYQGGFMKEWKRKINRKAAHVLLEIAQTGHFDWGLIRRKTNTIPELDTVRSAYLDSLKHRNLSKATIDLHDYVFRRTIAFIEAKTQEDLLSLSPGIVHQIVEKFAAVCSRRSMGTIIPILRLLLKYFYAAGLTPMDLSGIIMGVFASKGSVVPYLSRADQENLLCQLEKETKRTKVIILLAMKLGLRDCDICGLTFGQVDWQNDKIRLNQQKTGDPLVLPLLPDIGNVLMDYILNERPKRGDYYPYVFLREQAPYQKLSSIYPICSKFLERQKVKPVNGSAKGAHLLRYSLVRRLLEAKVPHQVITDVLGHASKESDKPYVSMEEEMLRMCALDLSVVGKISWDGGDLR